MQKHHCREGKKGRENWKGKETVRGKLGVGGKRERDSKVHDETFSLPFIVIKEIEV